jgi:threonine dehydratase
MALAYHGRELGIPATVVMPTVAPMAKVDKCRVSSTNCMTNDVECVLIWNTLTLTLSFRLSYL